MFAPAPSAASITRPTSSRDLTSTERVLGIDIVAGSRYVLCVDLERTQSIDHCLLLSRILGSGGISSGTLRLNADLYVGTIWSHFYFRARTDRNLWYWRDIVLLLRS
jgi:hypothetical protein